MFCNFAKNSKIQNGRHFLREIFCLKIGMGTLQRYPAGQKFHFWQDNISLAEIPCGSNISSKSLYLARFSRYKHFCVLQFCEKFENQNGRHFLREIFCLKIGMGTLQRYPAGQKFRRNRST